MKHQKHNRNHMQNDFATDAAQKNRKICHHCAMKSHPRPMVYRQKLPINSKRSISCVKIRTKPKDKNSPQQYWVSVGARLDRRVQHIDICFIQEEGADILHKDDKNAKLIIERLSQPLNVQPASEAKFTPLKIEYNGLLVF